MRTFVRSRGESSARFRTPAIACALALAVLAATAVAAAAPFRVAPVAPVANAPVAKAHAQRAGAGVAAFARSSVLRTSLTSAVPGISALVDPRADANAAGPVASSHFALAADAPPTLSAPPDVIVGEADGHVDLEVRLSSPSDDPVLVTYETAGSTGSSGGSCGGNASTSPDYGGVSTPLQLTFAPQQISRVVSITLFDCVDVEGLVSFTFILSNASNATIARTTTLVSIVDRTTVVTTPRLFVRDAVVDAKDGTVLVPVLLGGQSGQASTSPVTVNYETIAGTATAGADYSAVSDTLTFAPGQTAKIIRVPIAPGGPKPSRSFTVRLSGETNAEIADRTGTVVIGASAAAAVSQPAVSAPPDVVVGEGDGYVDLPVRLSAPGIDSVSVNYATANSTASSGSSCNSADYASRAGKLTFLPGETTKVVRVPVIDCGDVDGLASFKFTLSAAVIASIARASTLVSIVDNGAVVATPRLLVRDAVVDEKDGFVLVPVLLGGPAGQFSNSRVTVNYATSDRTASAGVDYTPVSGTLSFAPGQTVKTVVVPILDVPGPKPSKTFALSLNGVTNGATIADGTGTVLIGASAANPVPSPAVISPADTVVGEGDGYVDLAVRLSAPGENPVTIGYETTSGSAGSGTTCGAGGGDYVSITTSPPQVLVFAPGETTKVVRVQLLDCLDVEGLVSFRFGLVGDPSNATVARASTLVSIVNNATVVQKPKLFVRDAVVDEKDGSVLVPVLLGGPRGQTSNSEPVTVHYATDDRTAIAGVDYAPVSGTLSFAPGQTAKTVVVPIIDVGSKPSKSFVLSLSNVSSNGTISDGTGTVVIGASAAVAVASPALSAPVDVLVGEGDGYVDLPVRLSAPGLNPVSINYLTGSSTASNGTTCTSSSGNSADYVFASGTLNFSPGETTKVVRVPLLDCTDAEGLVSFRFELTGTPQNATVARSTTLVSIANASTVVENPRLVVRDAVADEKDGSVLVPVLLGGPAGQASDSSVTVQYHTSDGTATGGVDYTPVSGTLTFAPGQTVKNVVVPFLAAGPKSTRSFALNLTNVTSANLEDATGIVVIGASASAPLIPPALPALSAPPDIAVDEADGYVDLPVQLSAPSVTPVSVTYGTANNQNASAGSACSADYVSASGILTFAPGQTLRVVRVQILDCPDVDGVVSFKLTLTAQANATIARPTVIVSLVDNFTAWTPGNTALPVVSGTPQPGQTLTATPGAWSGAPTGYQFTWQRCDSGGAACGSITGANASTYVLAPGDGGYSFRVQVTATNTLGTSLPAYSQAVFSLPVAPPNVSASAGDGLAVVSFSPLSAGVGAVTYTVTVSPGGATVTGSGSPIVVSGLTNGVSYTFTVTATNPAGTGPASAPSNAVTPARRPLLPPAPPPPAPRPDVPPPPTLSGARPPKPSH